VTTVTELRAARHEFFDTRTNGRTEVWAALRLVCEMVEQGELRSAQAVLDAAGCTCPSGDLWGGRKGGIFDERGERYVVPAWVVNRPEGIIDDAGSGAVDDESMAGIVDDDVEKEPGRDSDVDDDNLNAATAGFAAASPRSKGKERVVHEDIELHGREMKVKGRLSHNAKDLALKIGEDDNVAILIKIIRRDAEVNALRTTSPFSGKIND
jgi:hypothetical protein